MTLQVAVSMRYLHERYFGRPACPKCGELMMASQSSEYVITSVTIEYVTDAVIASRH
jgi:hypothetical protein